MTFSPPRRVSGFANTSTGMRPVVSIAAPKTRLVLTTRGEIVGGVLVILAFVLIGWFAAVMFA